MPKLKTHKGAKARFYVTGSGKLMRRNCEISHFRRRMSKTAKRDINRKTDVDHADVKRIKLLLPYRRPR